MTTLTIEQAINDLAERHAGSITPEQLVEAASDPASPLHGYFEWDNALAAHQHRLSKARALIRSVRIEVKTTTHIVSSVAYVRDPDLRSREQGYIQVAQLVSERERGLRAIRSECERLRSLVHRIREIARGIDLADEAEGEIEAAVSK